MITAAAEPSTTSTLRAFRAFFFGNLKSGADDHHIGSFSSGPWQFSVVSYNASFEHNIPEHASVGTCCEVIVTGKDGRGREIIVSYVVGTRLKDGGDMHADDGYEAVAVSCVIKPATAPVADVVYENGKSAVKAIGNALRLEQTFPLDHKIVLKSLLGHTLKICKSIFGSTATAAAEPDQGDVLDMLTRRFSKTPLVKKISGYTVTVKRDALWSKRPCVTVVGDDGVVHAYLVITHKDNTNIYVMPGRSMQHEQAV